MFKSCLKRTRVKHEGRRPLADVRSRRKQSSKLLDEFTIYSDFFIYEIYVSIH